MVKYLMNIQFFIMIKKTIFAIVLISFAMWSCKEASSNTENSTAEQTEVTKAEITGQPFGEEIDAEGVVSYNELLTKLEGNDSLAVKVRAKVTDVCQAKGCWMNVLADDGQPEMFVKFKDYGFFVPKDIAGQEVIMEGYAYREFTPVDELRHYAEDEGKSAEEIAAITEPVEELKFMASGVLVLPKN